MERTEVGTEVSSLGYYLGIIRRRWWMMLLVTILALAFGVIWLLRATPVYEAQASLLRLTTNFDQALFQVQVFQSPDPARELQTGSDLIKTDVVAEKAKSLLETNQSAEELLDSLHVVPSTATDIIAVKAEAHDPNQAAAIANAFASAFIEYRRSANQAVIERARNKIDFELASMTQAEKASARGVTLMQKSEELRVLESMETGGYELVQTAKPPNAAASPRPVQTIALSLVVGIVFGAILALSTYLLDRRIKDGQMLEAVLGAPLLASLPPIKGPKADPRTGTKAANAVKTRRLRDFEPYRTLRSNLKYFAREQNLHSFLVTSSLPREGKTGTCVNLALSLAISGADVILLDADMRRPQLHVQLGLEQNGGIAGVLIGRSTFAQALQPVSLENLLPADAAGVDHARAGRLVCLTSGYPPPNPSELLDSPRMKELVLEASEQADYVLIDTPPVLAVSDALGFVKHVDGVILAARMNYTRLEDVRRAKSILERSGATVVGVVAAGAKGRRHFSGRYRSRYSYRGY